MSHLLCSWKDSYLFAFMFLQLFPFSLCVCASFPGRDGSVRNDGLRAKLSVLCLAFLHRDEVELHDEWKVQSLPQKSPFLTISSQPLQLCHLHVCVRLPSTTCRIALSLITYQHDSRQNKGPTESLTSCLGKLPRTNFYFYRESYVWVVGGRRVVL